MALVVKDRVRETSTTAGTGTITLAGAVTGFQTFAAIGDGNTTYYTIVDAGTGAWEVGIGTYTASTTSLSRDTVLESSNSGSLVNFGSNLKDVFVTYPAERSIYTDAAGTAITPATASVLGVASGGTGQSTYTDGQLLIGNSTGNTLAKSTLTAGTGISITNGSGSITVAATNNGDVVGPASSTDNAITRFDGASGKIIQNSGASIDDSGNLTATTSTASGTGANKMPVGTTAQRPGTPASGMYRLNSTLNIPEWYDAETSSWLPFSIGKQYDAELLIIAGGGGGGSGATGSLRAGSGGGAGGMIDFFSQPLTVGASYTIIVGAGGAGGAVASCDGSQGGNSSVSQGGTTIATAIGGGYGVNGQSTAGISGGSGGGGGAGGGTRPGGSGTSGQGNAGGSGYGDNLFRGGGGGGKGGAGGPGTSEPFGGASVNTSYSGTTIAYCGGGGGGGYSGASAGNGGGAGAGNGGTAANGQNATIANRGSGGGAGGGSTDTTGGSGSSGRVVIRYLGSQRGTGGTVTSNGGYTIHTFDSSGTFTA